jgi:hypothetical protein
VLAARRAAGVRRGHDRLSGGPGRRAKPVRQGHPRLRTRLERVRQPSAARAR